MIVVDLDTMNKSDAGAANPYGVEPKTADTYLSQAVINANTPVPQACWRNALLAYFPAVTALARQEEVDVRLRSVREGTIAALFSVSLPEPQPEPPLFYVEGHMIMPLKSGGQFSIEHAWLETEDGRVIETTIRDAAEGEAGWLFFTGMRVSMDTALNWLARNRNTLPLSPVLSRLKGEEAANAMRDYQAAMLASYWHAYGVRLDSLTGVALGYSDTDL